MIPDKIKKILKKQHYEIVGKHSAVQTCRWTKKSIKNEGSCYKEKFYGIKSHQCCQMTPCVIWCDNKCLHCWRAIELTLGNKIKNKIDSPKEIVDECINAQRKLLQGFKINPETIHKTKSKADMKKYLEAQEPMQFAISLSGEPFIYPKLGELINELRQRKKTSFVVTNGLYPEKMQKLAKENQLPTQIYVSVNSSDQKSYDEFHKSIKKNAWEKLNKTLKILSKIKDKTRTIFRINLIKDLNMSEKNINEFAELIRKASPLFVELKGFMSVGFARQRLGYEKMPTYAEMQKFAGKLSSTTGLEILNEHEFSRAFVLGKKEDEKRLKIKDDEI